MTEGDPSTPRELVERVPDGGGLVRIPASMNDQQAAILRELRILKPWLLYMIVSDRAGLLMLRTWRPRPRR